MNAGRPGRPRRIPVLVGPTASGKTDLSVRIAEILPVEIISADSRQVYRHMTIGTAKPDPSIRRLVVHHFIDCIPPDGEFNAGMFGIRGRRAALSILRRKKLPLVVGGSGLYVRALIDGLIDAPGADAGIRRKLESRIRTEGAGVLLNELGRSDPDAASSIHPRQTRRLVRALEILERTGSVPSDLMKSSGPAQFEPVMAGLNWPRATLYRRIDARVVAMINAGLIDEVRGLLERGYHPALQSLQTVGYREVLDYLGGGASLGELISVIRMNSRRFAKRQLTWFRADPRIRWFDIDDERAIPELAARIGSYFREACRF